MQDFNDQAIRSYMAFERQNRIDANNERINELTQMLIEDKKYLDSYEQVTLELQKIEEEMKNKKSQFHISRDHSDSSAINNFANQIEMFVDSIAELEEKLRMIKIMIESFTEKQKLSTYFVFHKYYKLKKQTAMEEANGSLDLDDMPNIMGEIFHFKSVYSSILETLGVTKTEGKEIKLEDLQELHSKYRKKQEELLNLKEEKLERITDMSKFRKDYPKLEKELEERKIQLQTQQSSLELHIGDIKTRIQEVKEEITELQRVNDIYISQISKLGGIETKTSEKTPLQKQI